MRLPLGEPLRVDALRTDAYIESLISGRSVPAGAAETAVDVDPEAARVARVLHATAWRPHPSFRFEERLAARLVAAARGGLTMDGAPSGAVVAFPALAAAAIPGTRPGAPLAGIASAALASAALSIGAAAVLAWRRGRPRGVA
jgi:hypothetical protein